MRTLITITLFLTAYMMLFSNQVHGQSEVVITKVESAFKKMPRSIRTNTNFKKAYSYFLLKEYDSTLLYAHNFINVNQKDDVYSDYCHFFRATSFQGKTLYEEARKEFELLPSSFPLYYTVLSKLGAIALEQDKFSEALDYYLEVKNLPEHIIANIDIDILYHDIGLCHLHLENYEESETYLLESLDIQEEKGNTSVLIGSYMNVANLYYVQYKDQKAIPYFEKAYNMSRLVGSFSLKQDAALNMAVVEENRKEYGKSLQYRKEYEQWRDSLNDQNKIYEEAQKEKKFIAEQKQQEIVLLEKDNRIKESQLNSFILTSILLLLIAGGVFYFYMSKRKANKLILAQKVELDALNDTKDRLFSVVSHDLRSNVNALDASNSKMSTLITSEQLNDLSTEVQHNTELTESIKGLLDNMLNWALLQTEQMYFQQENISLSAIVRQTAHNYLPLLKTKEMELVSDIPVNLFVYADIESIKIVLRNIIDNAIKFSRRGDQISIYSESKSDTECQLTIEDTGSGMNTSVLNELKQKTLSESKSINQERTGLGLHLCHAMIKKNGGTLEIQSQENVGTKLIITLPLSNDYE